VTCPVYTRYTLRLPAAAVPGGGGVRAAEVPDDWSGAAAYATPDEPPEYAHPEAVALVASLQPGGWLEEDDGDTIVFWLEEGAEAADAVAGGLTRLRALGRLEAAPERPGWEDAWRAFHRPQVVGKLYVRPPWYPSRDDLLDVVVEAGQGFGTGGHPTTRQCLEELQEIAPRSLLDLGCGSGVVSLAALRLGFGPVWGVDVDPAALRSAEENAVRNGLSAAFSAGDVTARDCALPEAATVVANIALRPILRLARRFAAGPGAEAPALHPDHLLLAGLLVEQADEAVAAFPAYGELRRRDDGEWALVHLVRRA
jgi:ribosomal protein L11 methyltransferase